MKVNIYYGGRGMVDDPTIFVMGKIQEELEELNVNDKIQSLRDEKYNYDIVTDSHGSRCSRTGNNS